METTTLFSSHGEVIIQTPNGNIVEHNVDSDSYINDVERFDIAEYNDWHFRQFGIQPDLAELDILNLGMFMKDGSYVEANEWRYNNCKPLIK